MNPPGEQSRKKASINKEGKEASGEKAGGGKAMHLCAAKCKPRGECRQKGVGNPFFIQGNTAQFTAEALSVASLADFSAAVTKMLANTQSIRCAFCLTCQKICRRDSTLRIVRCCPSTQLLCGTADTNKIRNMPQSPRHPRIFSQISQSIFISCAPVLPSLSPI